MRQFLLVSILSLGLLIASPALPANVALVHVDSCHFLSEPSPAEICSSKLFSMMAILTAFEHHAEEQGGLQLNKLIEVREAVQRLRYKPLKLTRGEVLPLGDILRAAVLTSAPEAAVAVVADLFPSPSAAAKHFNQQALAFGLTHTYFTPRIEKGRGQTLPLKSCSTLGDAALLAALVLQREEVSKWTRLEGMPFRNGMMIVRRDRPLIAHVSESAGNNTNSLRSLVLASNEQEGLRLVAAATGRQAWKGIRESMKAALQNFKLLTVVVSGQPVGTVTVEGGTVTSLSAVAGEAVRLPIRRGKESELSLALQLPARVQAPVAGDQVLGELLIARGGKLLAVVPLLSAFPVPPASWLHLANGQPLQPSPESIHKLYSASASKGFFPPVK